MKIVQLAVALLALVAVGCGQPEVDGRSDTASPASVAAGSVSCSAGEATCGAAGTDAIFRCVAGAGGATAWVSDVCAFGCIQAAPIGDGLHHDYCSQCDRGPSYCENGQRWSCGADGYYKRAGACSRCDCGGTYPHCRICE